MRKNRKKTGFFPGLLGLFLLFAVVLTGSLAKAEEKTHTIWFFFENVCASCHEEENFYDLFNRCVTTEEKASISYDVRTYNVFRSADEDVYEKALKESGKEKADVTLPVLYIDGKWLSGYDKIEQELHSVLFGEETTIEVSEKNTEKNKASEENQEWSLPVIEAEGKEPAVLLFTTYSCNDCEEIKEYL